MENINFQKRERIRGYFEYLKEKEDFEIEAENFNGITELSRIDKEIENVNLEIVNLRKGYRKKSESTFEKGTLKVLSKVQENLFGFLFTRIGCFAVFIYLVFLINFVGFTLLLSVLYAFYTFFQAREEIESEQFHGIEARNQKISREVDNLEDRKKTLQDARSSEINKIEFFREWEKNIEARFAYFLDIEDAIDKWFEEDKEKIVLKGLEKLKIGDDVRESGKGSGFYDSKVIQDPIVVYRPLTSERVEKNYILFGDFAPEIRESNSTINTYINDSDFYSIRGFDGKYRNSIFEFVIIYLTDRFLSCYKCYWNFLVGASSIVETYEVLYDSIVSFIEYERASLRQQNPYHKRKYQERMLISTSDGRRIGFRLSEDSKMNIITHLGKGNTQTSEFSRGAECIRYWLRQRRVDYQMVKRADE